MVDAKRFDDLATSLAGDGSSRRTLLQRLGGGGLAAALAAIGIGGIDVEEADARKSCRRRCKKRNTASKRRRCRRRCKKGGSGRCDSNADCTGFNVCFNGGCVLLPTDPGDPDPCDEGGECDDGLICVNDLCVLDDECGEDDDCDDELICLLGICVLGDGDDCGSQDDCVDPEVCLLGICVDIGLDL